MRTGVCYYPEHWPEERWTIDAAHMRRLGITVVRIGEFAWSRLEDADGTLHFDWLVRAIDTLHQAGLSVVMGTPTATPPRWMLDKYPDMLALDENGKSRGFGSRRHYCFSFTPYVDECRRIVSALAKCIGTHPGVIAWQTDNEYGCHSTSMSYSEHALHAFRQWCEKRYTTINGLNHAWGNVFWSMEYDHFRQIGLPVGSVTESNPAHQLAFWRFSSDQIALFNKAQVEILRKLSPGRDILHNFMGNFVEFDHHDVSKDLNIASWDNYPLGFLTRDNADPVDQARFLRTGHPDGSAFHHDLYRGCCNGRWWVMEQQPGPVNWAPYNPSPLPGMVRLWGWEAFAHGAEVMSYFRWRQAPFAQEQTHTGLLLSNAEDDVATSEVRQLNEELHRLRLPRAADETSGNTATNMLKVHSSVAIVFSYAGNAIQDIQLPGGQTYSPLAFCQRVYSACRQWGVNVDVVSSKAQLDDYKLIILCNNSEDDPEFVEHLINSRQHSRATLAMFPGTGSRNSEYELPESLPPGAFQNLIPIKVVRSESLPDTEQLIASNASGSSWHCIQWRERVHSQIEPHARFSDGWGFHYSQDGVHYINAIPEQTDLVALIGKLLKESKINARELGPFLRTQQFGPYRLAINFGPEPVELASALGSTFDFDENTIVIVGSDTLHQTDIALWAVR